MDENCVQRDKMPSVFADVKVLFVWLSRTMHNTNYKQSFVRLQRANDYFKIEQLNNSI